MTTPMAAGKIIARNCSVRLWDSSGSLSITAYGNNVTISESADDAERTAYGDDTHVNIAGLKNFSISYSGWWAGCNATPPACRLHTLIGGSDAMIQINPAGSAAGSPAYGACVNIQSLEVAFPIGEVATMSFTCTPRAGSMSVCPISVW